MSKSNTTEEKVSPALIKKLINTNPASAFDKLVSSGLYSKDYFWAEFASFDFQSVIGGETDPVQSYFLHRINGLKFYFELRALYKDSIDNQTQKLLSSSPDPIDVLKILFTTLDISEMNSASLDVKYSRESLTAMKIIYRTLAGQEQKGTFTDYSLELFNSVSQLLRLHVDNNMLDGFLDLYLMDDLLLFSREDGMGYELKFISDGVKEESSYIHEALKASVQRDFRRVSSHTGISDENHFRINDPKAKTDEGLAVIYHNSNVIINSVGGDGVTSVPMDDDIFNLMSSKDPVEQHQGSLSAMKEMLENNFHHKLRHALADIYQPNEAINIHAQHIGLSDGRFLTLFELLSAVCALVAMSDNIRISSDVEGFPAMYRKVKFAARNIHPEYTDAELDLACGANIASHLPMLEKRDEFNLFYLLSNDEVLSILRKVEELKLKADGELQSIIDLLTSIDKGGMPYNILYKSGDNYILAFQVCMRFPVARDFYDYFITERLFTNNTDKSKDELAIIAKNHKSREVRFNKSLRDLLLKLTLYVKANVDYKSPSSDYDFGELEGDIDVVAYFENEALIIPIQVKLSNRTPWNEKRKLQWVEDKLIKGKSSAVNQVNKDMQLLHNKVGLRFIAEQLVLEREINHNTLTIWPLIVTDNFFADHEHLPYGYEGQTVTCVSYFEIKNLISQQKVHEKQSDWKPISETMPGQNLIDLIEGNVFWDFLGEFVKSYSVKKSLVVINEENRIQLNI